MNEPKRSRTASAARTARSGSSSCAWGMPNTARTASPANFSEVPPNRSTSVLISVEELALELAHVLRIESLAECRRAREVGEQNGDDPPFLAIVGRVDRTASVFAKRNAAGRAERRAGRLLEPAGRTGPLERRAALAAEAGSVRALGSAVSADQSHAASLRRTRYPPDSGLAPFLFGCPLGGRKSFETLVRNRLAALDRKAVGTGGKSCLGTLDGGELLA